MKQFSTDQRGQLSIEGIVSGIIVVILYFIMAGYVFAPIYGILAPVIIACASGGYGTIATTLLSIAVYVIMPVLLMATMVTMARPKVEYVQ